MPQFGSMINTTMFSSFKFALQRYSQFPDHIDKLRAFIVTTFAWTSVCIILLVSLNYFIIDFSWLFFLSQTYILIMSAAALLLVRHNRLTEASRLFTFMTWILLVVLSLMRPGLNSLVFLTCLMITPMLAGFLLNTRTSVLITLVNFLLGFYMVWVENQAGYSPLAYEPMARMISYIGIFGTLPIIVFVSRVVFRQVIAAVQAEAKARQATEQVESQNSMLEKMLYQRNRHLEEMIEKHQKMAEKLESALLEANALSHMRARIIGTISHEFRTPITVINTSLDLLEKYGSRLSVEKRAKHQRRIKSGIYELVQLLDNVAGMNSIIKQGIVPKFEMWQAKTLFRTMELELRFKVDKNAKLQFKYPIDDERVIYTDRQLLLEVLHVLVTNALKFSDEKVPVMILFSHNDSIMRLIVTNIGIGIPQNEQNNIFHLLYRASNAEPFPGLGLGLHIAQKIVDAMYGKIECVNPEGSKVTQFCVTIPIKQTDQ